MQGVISARMSQFIISILMAFLFSVCMGKGALFAWFGISSILVFDIIIFSPKLKPFNIISVDEKQLYFSERFALSTPWLHRER